MIEVTFLKELMLIRQVNQKSAIFVTIVFFLNKEFKFRPNVWYRCHDLLMMSRNLSGITILNIKVLIITVLLTGLAKLNAKYQLTEKSGRL